MEKVKNSTKSTSAAKKSAVKTTKKTPKKSAAKKVSVKKLAKETSSANKASPKTAKKTPAKKVATKKAVVKKAASKKTSPKVPLDKTLELLGKCYKVMDDKKAMDLRALDMRGASSITNYVLLATATSEPHMKALANELEKTLKDMGIVAKREFGTGSGWFVVDAFDFMAHIFLTEQRDNYRMESLWKDAIEVPQELLI